MKKYYLLFSLVALLAAGCGSASQPTSQQVAPTSLATTSSTQPVATSLSAKSPPTSKPKTKPQSVQANTATQIPIEPSSQNTYITPTPPQPPSSQVAQVTPPPQAPAVINYSQYTPTYFYNYAGDPPAYLNTNIEVKGIINNQFLAAGDKGGDSNYIGIADPNAQSNDTVMLKISNNADYQKAVAALQYEDLVASYGSGAPSQYFTMTNGAKILVPIIVITRLDVIGACGVSGCGQDSAKTIFP